MSEPVLKFPASDKAAPAVSRVARLMQLARERRRFVLLVVVPLIAAIAGLAFYLLGGRYVTTDNAYVGAQKVLITSDISAKVSKVVVREGQRVAVGDTLFEFDAQPFQLALQQAQAKLDSARTDFANLRSNDRALTRLIELGQQNVELKQRDVERKMTLVQNRAGSEMTLDSSRACACCIASRSGSASNSNSTSPTVTR